MPFHDPDPTDPQILVGVVLPSNEEATREMAYVFAEEFARMGFDAEGIANLFRDPFYAGAHQVYRALGAEAVGEIVRECVGIWGRTAGMIQEAPAAAREDTQELLWPTAAEPFSMTNDK
ncbi:MAG: hypothetical protein HYY88_05325 [candidate division NC10 bacterium]|nr:hypothetical protein [candidate division NC10 bacterium]